MINEINFNEDKKLIEKKIESKLVFDGKIIKVYLDKIFLPNKKEATREKVGHPGAVAIVPVNKRNEVILTRQYRYPVEEVLTEIPAGKLDFNEKPENCARRELFEEVGVVDAKLTKLSSFLTTPGFSNELLHLFMATEFTVCKNNPDEDEFLHIIELPLKHCIDWINEGKIKDAKSIIGILMARDFLNNI